MTVFIVQYLFSALEYFVIFVLLMQILPNRLNWWKALAVALLFASHVIPKYLSGWNEQIYFPINMVQLVAFLAAVPLFLFQGRMLKKVIVAIYSIITVGVAEAVALTLVLLAIGGTKPLMHDLMALIIYNTLTAFIFILLGSASVIIWRMIEARKFQPIFLLFFILPTGQMITAYSYLFASSTGDEIIFTSSAVIWLVGLLLNVGGDMVLLTYVLSQEKKAALEEALREAEHQMQLEQIHYAEVDQRREAFTRIRHDFNNQLASVAQLIRANETDSALSLIGSVADEIHDTKENPYCAIPVVNAILTQKAQSCGRAGIGIEIELDMPPQTSVEPMHLCSVFSNLLDNAITACEGQESSVIRLTSKVDGDYLFVKVINPSRKPPSAPAPGRGYGTRILTELASRYSGDYRAEYEKGTYTAVISMLAVGEY